MKHYKRAKHSINDFVIGIIELRNYHNCNHKSSKRQKQNRNGPKTKRVRNQYNLYCHYQHCKIEKQKSEYIEIEDKAIERLLEKYHQNIYKQKALNNSLNVPHCELLSIEILLCSSIYVVIGIFY